MISIIVAIARNGVIGNGNALIWRIAEDLRRFKALTTGHPVIMGRKTYDSIGRPLPNRTNVVVTRRKDYRPEGCLVAGSLEQAVGLFDQSEEIFIIGGAQIYAQAMPMADRLYLTEIDSDYEGDTRFPEWKREECPKSDTNGERGTTGRSHSETTSARKNSSPGRIGYGCRPAVGPFPCFGAVVSQRRQRTHRDSVSLSVHSLIIPSVSRPRGFPPYRNVPRDLVRRQPFGSHGTVYDASHRYPARECGIPPQTP